MIQVDSGPAAIRNWDAYIGPCELVSFSGARTAGASIQYLQFYDLAGGGPPLLTRPEVVILWPSGAELPPVPRWRFRNGIVVAVSDNAVIYTAPAGFQWAFQAVIG